ncbi:LytR/AlgR family response regulator transcription factor [Wocania ichthyoenteri]|uniref:LytR/AlgR family response regulator transcription factor n=1 Tax=Wocania ichthyoenteri TaxID=1230531 RepID=UPI00053EA417|nr:LytTR family DNA-binding domain-containing protein [Wocania ichthyoenteri]
MLKTILVDDEKHCIEKLQSLLIDYSSVIQVVAVCSTVEIAKNRIETLNPDLVFLDVQLHEKTAFDLLKSIKNIEFHIIFTTAYDKYAIEAIKFSAFDYLLKPIDNKELGETLKRLNNSIETSSFLKTNALLHNTSKEKNEKIIIVTERETYFLNVADIIRCEADGTYTKIFLLKGKSILTSKTLKYYDELLNTNSFFRIHQSHLINTAYIKKYIKGANASVIMIDKCEIPIAKRRKEDFLKLINMI